MLKYCVPRFKNNLSPLRHASTLHWGALCFLECLLNVQHDCVFLGKHGQRISEISNSNAWMSEKEVEADSL